MVKVVTLICATLLLATTPSRAETPDAADSAKVQSCIKSAEGRERERCIGVVADPCAEDSKAQSTAGQVACATREFAVWDDILNETFRRLRDKLDDDQKTKLRDMQRAWITYRDTTCGFYHDKIRGTMATPMAAACVARETARRALLLKQFQGL